MHKLIFISISQHDFLKNFKEAGNAAGTSASAATGRRKADFHTKEADGASENQNSSSQLVTMTSVTENSSQLQEGNELNDYISTSSIKYVLYTFYYQYLLILVYI